MHPALAGKHRGKSVDGSNLFATGRDLTVMQARSTGCMVPVNPCIFVLSVGKNLLLFPHMMTSIKGERAFSTF